MQGQAAQPLLTESLSMIDGSFWNDQVLLATKLRSMVGDYVRAWTPQHFLEFVTVVIGTWADLWSMKTMVLKSVFAFLINVKKMCWALKVLATLYLFDLQKETRLVCEASDRKAVLLR